MVQPRAVLLLLHPSHLVEISTGFWPHSTLRCTHGTPCSALPTSAIALRLLYHDAPDVVGVEQLPSVFSILGDKFNEPYGVTPSSVCGVSP